MNPTMLPNRFASTYPTARIRGRLVTRLEEQSLKWVTLDAMAAKELGRDQLGWFIGGHPGEATAAEQLGNLDGNPAGGIWVAIPYSRDLSRKLFEMWPHPDHVCRMPDDTSSAWRSRRVWVAVPEDLKELLPFARRDDVGVAGLIIIDPPCIMYKTRGGTDSWGKLHRNDRPQHVVNFRAAFSADGWQPPLLMVTGQAPSAIPTLTVARAFCLNGFRFIAGNSFACWDEPIEEY